MDQSAVELNWRQVVDYGDTSVTCTLRLDDQLVLRVTLPRGGADDMPQMPMTTYTLAADEVIK